MSHEERRLYGNARMRSLAKERGPDWDTMDEEEKDQFVIAVIED